MREASLRQRSDRPSSKEESYMKTKKDTRAASRTKRPEDVKKNLAAKAEQKRFLKKRLAAHAKEQPEILKLQRLLHLIGGGLLVAPPRVTHDMPFLIESGFVMDYPVTERIMRPSMCHLNSAELFATGKATGLGVGFALSEDGLWRQHSWALKRQKDGTNLILETTGKRLCYFGILYWGLLGKCIAKQEFEFNGIKLPPSLEMLPPFEKA